jgi:hypothetical protein
MRSIKPFDNSLVVSVMFCHHFSLVTQKNDEKVTKERTLPRNRIEVSMQMSISTSFQQSQLDFSQLAFSQSEYSGPAPSLPSPQQDRVELSDQARRPRDREHSVDHVRGTQHERTGNPLGDFLKNILEQLTGAQVNDLQNAPIADEPSTPVPQDQQTSIAAQQASVSLESNSLSISGSINTSDGAKVSFALDLQILHASASTSAFTLSNGQNGYEFNFVGSSAELSNTSFSFSLTSETPDGALASGSGQGSFSLKDELKEVRHVLKPLLKGFLNDAGMPSDRRSFSQLLHAIA